MAKNKLTQCEIRGAEENYSNVVTEYNSATQNLCNGVERLIRMLYNLDYKLLQKHSVQITYIDGEMVTFYRIRYIEVNAENDIVIVAEDDYGEDETFELSDLSYEEIYCLGAVLFDQYQEKYGEKMTYKDMVEASKKIV